MEQIESIEKKNISYRRHVQVQTFDWDLKRLMVKKRDSSDAGLGGARNKYSMNNYT